MADRPDEKSVIERRLEQVSLRELDLGDVQRLGVSADAQELELSLRCHGEPERLDRVWGRVDGSLRAGQRWQRRRPLVGLAAAAAVFVLGVMAGRSSLDEAPAPPAVHAEQWLEPEPASVEEEPRARERAGRSVAAPTSTARRAPPRARPERGRTALSSKLQEDRSEPVLEMELVAPRPAPVVEVPRWLLLADRGEYAAAFQAVEESGGFDAVLSQCNAEELMTLADVARAAGQQGRAIQALRRVVQRYQDDPNAPVAAIMLGNLLHRAGDVAGAAEAYALNRSLSPEGDFAEDALARGFEVALEAGDLERARGLATQYEREFPQGRRLGEIREQLERAEADGARQGVERDGAGREGGEPAPGERTAPRE